MPLLIFDLISTISNSAPRYIMAFIESAKARGLPTPLSDDLDKMLGEKRLSEIVTRYYPDIEDPQTFMSECNQQCDAYLEKKVGGDELYPGVLEGLGTLKNHGFSLALYSGSRQDAVENLIHYHNLGGFFPTAQYLGRSPEMEHLSSNEIKAHLIQKIISQSGEKNAQVYVIGDSLTDLNAANSLGINFIGLGYNNRKADILRAQGCTTVFTNFSDLVKHLFLNFRQKSSSRSEGQR